MNPTYNICYGDDILGPRCGTESKTNGRTVHLESVTCPDCLGAMCLVREQELEAGACPTLSEAWTRGGRDREAGVPFDACPFGGLGYQVQLWWKMGWRGVAPRGGR